MENDGSSVALGGPSHFALTSQAKPMAVNQTDRPSLLMQDPSNQSFNVTGFSFSKPASHRKGFTLRSKTTHSLVTPVLTGYHSQAPHVSSHADTDVTHEGSSEQIKPLGTATSRSGVIPTRESTAAADIVATFYRPSSSQSIRNEEERAESTVLDPPAVISKHLKGDERAPKRRREGQKSGLSKRQTSASRAASSTHQLTEDKLFELLIGKIRQREENEASAAEIQRRTEAENGDLKEQNRSLQHQVDTCKTELEKACEEARCYQSQIDTWKANLRKFKRVIDELGQDFETLQKENERFKSISGSLRKEKDDLIQDIDSIRIQILCAEKTVDDQRSKLLESDHKISILKQALTSSEEQEKILRGQLSDEKKRSTTLEFYIKTSSRNQTRQLGLIRGEQRQLLNMVTSGFESTEKALLSSKEVAMSEIGSGLRECRSSIQSLTETCSAQGLNIHQFQDTAHDVMTQVKHLSTQFAVDIASSTKVSVEGSKSIQEGLQKMKTHFGTDSELMKQLNCQYQSQEILKERLQVIEPTLNKLNDAVGSLLLAETRLAQGLGEFNERLTEAQILASHQTFKQELSAQFAENTQLQLRLQEAYSETKSLRQELWENKALNQNFQQSLADATTQQQIEANLNLQLKSEKEELQIRLESDVQKTRIELSEKHAALVDEINVQHLKEVEKINQEIETASRERKALEASVAELIVQLEGVRGSLDEANSLMDEHKAARQTLAEKTEGQIFQLAKACSESTAQLQTQATELEKYQRADAVSQAEISSLREQLQQIKEKYQDLNREVVSRDVDQGIQEPPTNNIVPFATIESRMSPPLPLPPYDDPGDFAMLFMSDEPFSTVPFNRDLSTDIQQIAKHAIRDDQAERSSANEPDSLLDGPEESQRQTRGKRKGVNFELQCKTDNSIATDLTSAQPQTATNERPNKVSKHVHKWTYSRVHSSATQIEEGSSTIPAHAASGERRPSPKGLVSASSESKPVIRSNCRGRGRRRSRGERYNARFTQGD